MNLPQIKFNTAIKIVLLVAAIVVVLLFLIMPPVWKLNDGSVIVSQWQKKRGELKVEVGPSQKQDWISSNHVSKHLLNAVIVAEDSRFYEHSGIDLMALKSAIEINMKHHKYVLGASTITQQVVKVCLLSRDKTLFRKFREALGAIFLEFILTKTRILEWYINTVEFGDGVYGIKNAAQHYFQTKPDLITIAQAINLALILPSPNGWSGGLRRKDLTDFGKKRFATIAHRMRLAGFITDAQLEATLATGNFGRPVSDKLEQYPPISEEELYENRLEGGDEEQELDSDAEKQE